MTAQTRRFKENLVCLQSKNLLWNASELVYVGDKRVLNLISNSWDTDIDSNTIATIEHIINIQLGVPFVVTCDQTKK